MGASYALSELADRVGGTLRGTSEVRITGVASVVDARPCQASWLSSSRYDKAIEQSEAGVVLVSSKNMQTPMPAIVCEHLPRSIAELIGLFTPPPPKPSVGVHPTAVIDPSTRLGDQVAIGPHVVVESGASIGARTALHAGVFIGQGSCVGADGVLWPNVVVRDGCEIGERVMIHPGAVIGADGLGFYFDQGRHHKVPHGGGVRIGDDVEIGACSCIDRSKFGWTTVENGTKIDNMVQIAHNVTVGEHVVVAAQSALAGSAVVGNYCVLGGRVGVVEHVHVGDGVQVGVSSVITKNMPAGITVSGVPAREHALEQRERATLRRLPKLVEQIKALQARVERLEAEDHST